MLRNVTLATAVALGLSAQEPPQQTAPPAGQPTSPVFEYDGKPITLPFRCSLDDIGWAGMSCSEDEPCPIYLELSSVEGVGDRVFAAGNIHSESVTLYSVLLSSADGGHSWQVAPDSLRGAGLDRIQLLDALTGWVDGQTLFPIPQDPFFLLTTDGGKSWRLQPIFGDSHYGSIQQFWFDSKTSGGMILDNGPGDVDRFARYETGDGGETWSLKEENKKPLQLKRPTVNSTWRVRADAATRSYRIEHRTGSQWTVVAAFSVKLPPCKPE
jgi:hypothetical protein